MEAARKQVDDFRRSARLEHGVTFEIDPALVDKIVDIDHYEFEKGYSYVAEQLQDKLFHYLAPHFHQRGETIKVKHEDTTVEIGDEELPATDLVLEVKGKPVRYNLGAISDGPRNPWGDNPEMMERIRHFASNMSQHLKGNEDQIMEMKDLLKLKSLDWRTRVVMTQIGTSGNGKTEFAKATARALWGDESAMFSLSGLTDKYKVANFLRPPTGIQGGKEETEFERWFKARKDAGGGVILLDELLSFAGLTRHEVSQRVEAINEFYDLLDEGKIRFGNKVYDARGFIVVVTGNAMQEVFRGIGDDPDSERVAQKIKEKVTYQDIVEYLTKMGIDPPKIARFGRIFLNGPLPKVHALEVGQLMIGRAVREAKSKMRKSAEIHIDPEINELVVENLTTNELGMREVNKGFETLVTSCIGGIATDIRRSGKIEAKLGPDKVVHWFVDGKEVVKQGLPLGPKLMETNWVYKDKMDPRAKDLTPKYTDMNIPERLKYTPETLANIATHEVYGHWMMRALLERRNGADAISLYAGKSWLGYVRPKEDELYEIESLNKLLKTMMVLQAGHRSVFHTGKFATGGGGSGEEKPGAQRSDDFGRMQKIMKMMIANKLVPGLQEGSSARERGIAIRDIDELVEIATDIALRSGMESKKFDHVYEHLIKERFAGGEELDKMAVKIDYAPFGSPDEFFLNTLTQAVHAILGKGEHAKRDVRKFMLYTRLLARVYREAEAKNAGNGAVLSKIDKIREKGFKELELENPIDPITGNCKDFYTMMEARRELAQTRRAARRARGE